MPIHYLYPSRMTAFKNNVDFDRIVVGFTRADLVAICVQYSAAVAGLVVAQLRCLLCVHEHLSDTTQQVNTMARQMYEI